MTYSAREVLAEVFPTSEKELTGRQLYRVLEGRGFSKEASQDIAMTGLEIGLITMTSEGSVRLRKPNEFWYGA